MDDKAGEEYWTRVWEQKSLPAELNIHSWNVNHYPDKVLHQAFSKIFQNGMQDKTLLEIGCGNSVFLTYFRKTFGFKISGIDYSELGCRTSRAILDREGIEGEIIFGDAFNPPDSLLNSFDVVCSFGVVEHFDHTTEVLSAFLKFVKPGGILITMVPNFVGATGYLHKILNRPVYDIHVPMTREFLDSAHEKAGMHTIFSKYILAISFAITLEGKNGERIPYFFWKKLFIKTIRYASKIIWLAESVLGSLPAGKNLSGAILIAARKPS
jgi:2-polyprenyl-3-methyl-5-hydroxy-6-metoxy-1,4-benzoquinol methylase